MRKPSGLLLIASGLALAALTAVLVIGIARQASAAGRAQVRQVAVVVATRDILDRAQVTADALELKAFPADFSPPGAFSSVQDVVGKYSQGFIPKGQVIVSGQLQLAPAAAPNVSGRITPGMVVMWLPMPDVLANTSVLKPGDHVDVLLTAPLKTDAQADKQASTLSTQTTLQNVEVYRVGDEELNGSATTTKPAEASSAQRSNGTLGSGTSAAATTRSGPKALGLLVDHQDAVTMKFVKDAGGTIDLVTRSGEDQQVVRTDGVTLDSLADRFRFRVPQPVQRTDTAKQST